MKPMKIMRYGGTYRYNRNRTDKKNIVTIAVIAGVVVLAVAAVIILRMAAINKARNSGDTLNMAMKDGTPVSMDVKEGDICMLTMPKTIDIREVVFESSDSSIVRVDSAGHTDALKEGKATVTATARNFRAECHFTVAANPEPEKTELTTAIIANLDVLKANKEKGSDNLYSITVNRRTNTVTVYTYDEKGEYTVPVRAMVASCGTSGDDATITGDFALYFQQPWHPLYGNVYGMFTSGFSGPYLFHSVPYETSRHDTLEAEEFNKLGKNASQGCVRMMVADCYWIWKNCPLDTPVHVIDAESKADPLGKPATVKLPADAVWDPTDDTKGNPYRYNTPVIEGVKDAEIKKGASFDPMAGVKATDIIGYDVTDQVTVAGQVLSDKPGTYNLTYTYTDEFHQRARETCTVTVKE